MLIVARRDCPTFARGCLASLGSFDCAARRQPQHRYHRAAPLRM